MKYGAVCRYSEFPEDGRNQTVIRQNIQQEYSDTWSSKRISREKFFSILFKE